MNQGHEVEFIDALKMGKNVVQERQFGDKDVRMFGLRNEDIVDMIPSDSDYIAIGVPFTFLGTIAKELTGDIKKRFEVPIIMGGVFPSTLPELAVNSADFIVRGEGEIPLRRLLSGEKPEEINGFHSTVFSNGSAEFVTDLNNLPFPYREDGFEEHLLFSSRGRKGQRTASLVTSRGCPYTCNFCSTHPTAGYKWRARSVDDVVSEIVYLQERFGVNHLEIEDDNFTLDSTRAKGILERIIKYKEGRNLHLDFSTPNGLRIDTLDRETITLMKKAGFKSIYLALESGDQEVLSLMNKRLSLDKVSEVAKLASEQDLPILYFFMIGYPGETREMFLKSVDFGLGLKKIGDCSFTTFLTRAYPGTKLFDDCLAKGYIADPTFVERDVFLGDVFQIKCPEFDAKELERRLHYAQKTLNRNCEKNYCL